MSGSMSDLKRKIEEHILTAVPNAHVIVRDPLNDNAHFEATVVSEVFVGMPLAHQHRRVMQSLKDLFAGEVHALSLKTYTPEKWAKSANFQD